MAGNPAVRGSNPGWVELTCVGMPSVRGGRSRRTAARACRCRGLAPVGVIDGAMKSAMMCWTW